MSDDEFKSATRRELDQLHKQIEANKKAVHDMFVTKEAHEQLVFDVAEVRTSFKIISRSFWVASGALSVSAALMYIMVRFWAGKF